MEPSNPRSLYGPDGIVGAVLVDRPPPYRPRWWLHVLLFVATCASTTFIGGLMWSTLPVAVLEQPLLKLIFDPALLAAGLWFSVPIITILLCHEMGHYIACRRHGLLATPPYFLPFPVPIFPIGTLGAVIRIKEPIRNKRQLLDVGASGPIAGFVAALPFLAFGIAASEMTEAMPDGSAYLSFGEPLVYRLLEAVVRPEVDGGSLLLHPSGVAAWFGLLVTLLNLLPFAQLDGGHILYALLGGWHRRLVWPLMAGLVVMGFLWSGWWLWVVIAMIMGPRHPPIWDEDVPLDRRRQIVAVVCILIFVLCFMLSPIELVLDPSALEGSP